MSESNTYFDSYMLLTFAITFIVYYIYKKCKNQIPGPYCLPLVGYLPFLGNEPHKTFEKLSKKYGPIIRVQLGTVDIVVLNDFHSIKDAFSKDEFLGRPKQNIFTINAEDECEDLEGQEWLEQRRFAIRTFKDMGFAKAAMEDHIVESIEELSVNIDNENGEPRKLLAMLHASTLNILLAYFTGKRYDFKDKEMTEIVEAAFCNEESATVVDLSAFFPFLTRIFAKFELFGFATYKNLAKTLMKFSDKIIEEVENDEEQRKSGTNFIPLFLNEIEKAAKTNSKTTFTRPRLLTTIFDYVLASTDTVGTLFAWIVICLCKFPEWQQKIQIEIESIVGNDRLTRLTDRKQLIQTQAFIFEVQRWISFMPINLPRRTIRKVTVHGIEIPEDTQILANFYAAHRDEKVWQNADEFKPERFISEDGKGFINVDKILTFSTGKRACPGEVLGSAEILLYTTHLLQKYNIESVDGLPPSMDCVIGVTLRPKFMNFKFINRKC